MNVEQFRQSLKATWLNYYRDNRSWLVHLGIWINDGGHRRPSSGFILATLSVLEPRLTQILPLIVELNSNPDRVISALGLNFSPDDELDTLIAANDSQTPDSVKLLPSSSISEVNPLRTQTDATPSQIAAKRDESCQGVQGQSQPHPYRHPR